MTNALKPGDLVVLDWGLDEVRGIVAEVYGEGPARRVVVELTPELSWSMSRRRSPCRWQPFGPSA